MKQRPDAALEVALEQRQRRLDQERQVLAERELVFQEHAQALSAAQARVRMILMQIDEVQAPVAGVPLPVAVLSELEQVLLWCELQVVQKQERYDAAREETDVARGVVAVAHQQVRALELVLEARAAERAEKQRRVENRQADETAARVHARNLVAR